MALKDFQFSFTPVSPLVRATAAIATDLNAAGGATDATRAAVAAVESHIANGDNLYNAGQYSDALSEYKQAQTAIFKILYPDFDAGFYVRWTAPALPVSAALESSLLNASARMVDVSRPLSVPTPPVTRRFVPDGLPGPLQSYTATGFRESVSAEQKVQMAAAQAVALLQDQKSEAAVDMLSDTLAQITNPAGAASPVDPGLQGSLELNLSAAYLQSGDPKTAAVHANSAAGQFKAANDLVGQAQAFHLSGISAIQAGNPTAGQQYLQTAAGLLKSASGGSPVPGVTPGTVHTATPSAGSASAAGAAVAPAVTGTVAELQVPITRDLTALDPIAKMSTQSITVRITGREDGWGVVPVLSPQVRKEQSKPWQIGVPTGAAVSSFTVASGQLAAANDIVAQIYKPRISATQISALIIPIVDTSSTTFYLTHLYAYVLPVKLGDTYNKLGQYAHAESSYLQAASYSYLNQALEAPALWVRIAQNATDWGDTYYKAEDLPNAQAQYSKLVTVDAKAPGSVLYTTASLTGAATTAKTLIQNLAARPIPVVYGEIAILVLTAYSKLQQIAQNLDFYGLLLTPIHTFEYLQGVARGFAQEASQAEQQFINYTSRQEAEEQTRRDLEATAAMAQAEADAKFWQYQSAQDDARAAQAALDLANKRVSDAIAERNTYQSASSAEIWAQAAAQALQGGQDALYNEISELANRLANGETISGPGPKLAAAETLYAGRKTQAYELQKMQDNINELQKGVAVAQAQRDSANARAISVEVEYQAALQRVSLANASLEAFDNDFFTPETWSKMADVMRAISREYLYRGIRIAKLMERAYNFDNDTNLKVIKNDYGVSVAKPAAGRDTVLLGGDSLLADIDSFTFQAIATKTRKSSRIKDVISVATDFPAQFDAFRTSGLLKFETDLYEFDRKHPGFYAQRIESVEMELIGLLPDNSAPEGTLTAGGVTNFRKVDGSVGKRVHQIDTMALSNFTLRGDSFLYSTETGVRGLFQGYGVGATWQMHLPKRSNNFDFRRIFDVNLILYYTAMYDAGLETSVLTAPPKAGELELLRTFALRYDFPDIWYAFYQGGIADFTLDAVRLPFNQQNFKVKSAQFRIVTKSGVSNQNIALTITGPNGFTGSANTDTNGAVSSLDAALAGLAGANPLGEWKVQVTGGASITEGGVIKFDRIYNLQFGLEYSYEYVPEVV
jgi:hypothetical protein